MPEFEYKVIPAPSKGEKAKGLKSPEARFAHAIESLMNRMAADGWEYQRADMLPSDERQGLTGSTTNWRNILVFRRDKAGILADFQPRVMDAEPAVAKAEAPEDLAAAEQSGTSATTTPPQEAARRAPPPLRPASGAERILKDNGVEELSDVSGMTAALRARAEATRKDGTTEVESGQSDRPAQ
ncbi:DUF4177 domain-containing protein [Aestuariivita sp.]|jgi:hypothetical protein|uniref:DUF4177 domain-containing protein n=1 Tax=Aestuariivita sp. TaxID=1872407 RepID=UPI00216E9B11|nr:DUF4177 domain-containing protein [Aestuariivita sp.]MCE8008895.1 DUF4177 domain-containing protein [Aestuariivita sp.]